MSSPMPGLSACFCSAVVHTYETQVHIHHVTDLVQLPCSTVVQFLRAISTSGENHREIPRFKVDKFSIECGDKKLTSNAARSTGEVAAIMEAYSSCSEHSKLGLGGRITLSGRASDPAEGGLK